jgi:hypothetical protein
VIFFPLHTTPDYTTTGVDDVSSIKYLSEIREAGSKVIICIHWHDLGGAREALFRDNGFETTSLGNPYDKDFVDKFYALASKSKFAVTESYTSAVPFFIDAGVPCVILKRSIEVKHVTKTNEKFGTADEEARIDLEEADEIFSMLTDVITDEQRFFAHRELGYEFSGRYESNRKLIMKRYIKELPLWLIGRIIKRIMRFKGISLRMM